MDKINAIKYIIYRVAQQFNIYNSVDKNDVNFFNLKNNFSLEKCLMLPYIITIANGNKNYFLDKQGIFVNSFYPILESSKEKVLIGHSNYTDFSFKLYNNQDLSLAFNSNGHLIIDNNFFDETKYSIDLKVKQNIEYSIKFFEERRFDNFSILNTFQLSKITSQNSAFDVINNFCISKNIKDDFQKVLLFNIVAKESFYFTYFNDKLENDIKFDYVH